MKKNYLRENEIRLKRTENLMISDICVICDALTQDLKKKLGL